jgi:hypothetical protein
VPIHGTGRRVGTIALGPQRSGSAYAARDEVALASLASTLWDAVARELDEPSSDAADGPAAPADASGAAPAAPLARLVGA